MKTICCPSSRDEELGADHSYSVENSHGTLGQYYEIRMVRVVGVHRGKVDLIF